MQIRRNKLIYQEKPRLKTALELLRTSMALEQCLGDIKMPFFILHGEADTVTDPEVSRALWERAASLDKTMKLYPGMWHGLTSGEPDSNINLVFSDIILWLDLHAAMPRAVANCSVVPMIPAQPKQRRRRAARLLCGLSARI